jgi:predicted amidohydrolase
MSAKTSKLILIAIALCVPAGSAYAIDNTQARAFAGRDIQITADELTNYHDANGTDVIVINKKVSIAAGADTFAGEKAVVWLKRTPASKNISVWCCVSGDISAKKGNGTRIVGLSWETIENGKTMVVRFEATGEVFITAKKIERADVRSGDFYNHAFTATAKTHKNFANECAAVSPVIVVAAAEPNRPAAKPKAVTETFVDQLFGGPTKKPQPPVEKAPEQIKIRYSVNLSPAGEQEPNIEWGGSATGEDFATVIGRFYLWQKQDENGRLLEMQADNAVVFYAGEKTGTGEESGGIKAVGAKGAIKAIYVRGDVVMTEGLRTIRADEIYYDFENKRGLAVNATMRTFDVERGIPIYVRAAKIRQVAEGKFTADNVVVTSSEFATPQISLDVGSIIVTDTTTIDQQAGQPKDSGYDAQMRDIRLKAEDMTVFYWPSLRSNLERPDMPLKSLRIGKDNIWGTTIESRWFLSRLLGLREPDGTDGTFDLDYLSKRGVGTGMDVDYQQDERLGKITSYLIDDRGEDRLGRVAFRRNLKPPEDLRGRFSWVDREFLPYNWQVTTGIDYESDENFLESYRRREYNTGPDRETYIHIKRIEDNWGLAFLAKGRINNFADELEEAPTGEYHLTGQSIFDDKMTLYSDTYGGRYKQQIGKDHTTVMDESDFGLATHRTEIDLPMWASGIKVVPYAAGTVGYDERSGFNRSMVDGSNTGTADDATVGIGELGMRSSTEFWKTYPDVKSRLWDLNGLRHIVTPGVSTSIYGASDEAVKQHDSAHVELLQRLQTKRGPDDRTVDWMRLNMGMTWFTDNDKRTPDSGPYRYLWNNSMTPLRTLAAPEILNGDIDKKGDIDHGLKKFETYGPVRDYFDTDYMWQISDTTALLTSGYYDIHSERVEQFDIGFSRTRLPDLSYYIGTRYLRDVQVLNQHGSNAFVFAASYALDSRYTIVFSQQYDFEYRANVQSELTLIRRYHRMFWSISVRSDASLDSKSVMFNLWPEGVPESASGSKRYTGLSGPGGQ